MNDIIMAVATPQGKGGVTIIRVVGEEVFSVCNELFISNKKLENQEGNTIIYRKIYHGNKFIDEILLSKFVKPNSFTGENTIEINCHGGLFVTKEITSILIEKGIRMAHPGEFSKLAFLNEKKTLSELQSTFDLINSFSETTYRMAINGLKGNIDAELNKAYKNLIIIKNEISVKIDYPEYNDLGNLESDILKEKLIKCKSIFSDIIEDSKRGMIYKNGIKTAIIGKPNVGKSTLLNLLANESKAIVSDIPGTTRDIIQADVLINDIRLNLLDTAGIRETEDKIEKIGIEKSLEMIKEAELVIFILDAATNLTKEEENIYKMLNEKNNIILKNKSEIGRNRFFSNEIEISFHEKKSIKTIEKEIMKKFDLHSFEPTQAKVITEISVLDTIQRCFDDCKKIIENLEYDFLEDIIEIELNELISNLGEIIGKSVKDDYLNDMFGRFCLGK